MKLDHVDRPPFGDMVETLTVMAFTNPGIAFTVDLQGDEFHEAATGVTVDQAREQLVRATQDLENISEIQ
jgi:hypothetical protein